MALSLSKPPISPVHRQKSTVDGLKNEPMPLLFNNEVKFILFLFN